MMTDTISFTDIVKLVHPDHNPNIQDAALKIKDIMLFRSDENILFKFAVKWGLVKAPAGFDTTTETPAPSATAEYQARKLREYKDLIAKQKADNLRNERSRAEQQRANRDTAKKADQDEYYKFRVRNRIFQKHDRIYVRTKRANVTVTRTSETRVYFYFNGRESYAAKKNVRHTRNR
jgi:hypothetical protein